MTGSKKDCPCNGCLPPKRHSWCHATCKEYKTWSNLREERNTMVHEAKEREEDCFPNKLRNYKQGRKT